MCHVSRQINAYCAQDFDAPEVCSDMIQAAKADQYEAYTDDAICILEQDDQDALEAWEEEGIAPLSLLAAIANDDSYSRYA